MIFVSSIDKTKKISPPPTPKGAYSFGLAYSHPNYDTFILSHFYWRMLQVPSNAAAGEPKVGPGIGHCGTRAPFQFPLLRTACKTTSKYPPPRCSGTTRARPEN